MVMKMVHSFKLGGHRLAYDSGSGTLHILDELAFKMLDYIELPMPKDCPSALRYDLAKYDSAAIDDTYAELYKLYIDGKLYSDDKTADDAVSPEAAGGALLTNGTEILASHANPHMPASLDEYVGKLEITPADSDALTEEDVSALIKELDRAAKPFVAAKRNPFAEKEAFAHSCENCWAKNICSLKCKSASLCALECRRLDYQLTLNRD